MKRVAVGLSGGVDSAVAVLLLQRQGLQPVGVYLRMFPQEAEEAAARNVAEQLRIPFVVKDLTARFEREVMHPFAESYRQGETPSPCVFCNPAVKFQGLLDAADGLGCEQIATGHYAGVEAWRYHFLIRRREGQQKDQSYMLYRLGQEVLSRLLLPLWAVESKEQVRALAAEAKLTVAEKKDSLDLCFLDPDQLPGDLVMQLDGKKPAPGPILDMSGRVLGTHKGLCYYTVGQRRGLGIAAEDRLFVIRLDRAQNAVILGPREALETREVSLSRMVLHVPLPEGDLTAKVRYQDRDTPVRVTLFNREEAVLQFAEPKLAAAPGQSAVIYWNNFVVGGGIIKKSGNGY